MAFEMTLDQNQSRKTSDSNGAAEPDSTKNPECVHMGKNSKLTYQGIEYPPAFEPETYTLQHMLKNRQRRNHDSKK